MPKIEMIEDNYAELTEGLTPGKVLKHFSQNKGAP